MCIHYRLLAAASNRFLFRSLHKPFAVSMLAPFFMHPHKLDAQRSSPGKCGEARDDCACLITREDSNRAVIVIASCPYIEGIDLFLHKVPVHLCWILRHLQICIAHRVTLPLLLLNRLCRQESDQMPSATKYAPILQDHRRWANICRTAVCEPAHPHLYPSPAVLAL